MTTKNMSFDLQNGGLRLIQTSNVITSFDAVYQMITNPLSTLTKISYSSLKGFIFKLDVPHDVQHTYFYGINDSGTSYNVPVYTLILKFAIITDRTESLPNFIYMHDSHNKSTENLIEYATESKTQQDIYVATVSPSGNPICPAVADFSYFDSTSGEILLAKLIKNTNNSATNAMIDYLRTNIFLHTNRKLGMIAMEIANNSIELENLKAINPISYNANIEYAIAQIFILFTKLKVINYDSHSKNVLANQTTNKSLLIDFGRTINLINPVQNITNIIQEYNVVTGGNYDNDLRDANIHFTNLYESRNNSIDQIIVRMQNIIKLIAYVDYVIKKSWFKIRSTEYHPQMNDLIKYLYGNTIGDDWQTYNPIHVFNSPTQQDVKEKYRRIITLIYNLTNTPITHVNYLSKKTIDKKYQNNELFSLNPDILFHDKSSYIYQQQRQQRQQQPQQRQQQENINKIFGSIIAVSLVGYIMYKFFSGGNKNKTRKSSPSMPKNNKKQIIQIITQIIKENNCGLEVDVDIDDIQPVSKTELEKVFKENHVVIAENHETCDLNNETIYIPPIQNIVQQIKRQMDQKSKVMREIKNHSKKIKSI